MLLLASCTPQQEEMALEYIDQLEAVQEMMIEVYPYFTNWDYCIINGEHIENIEFVYTEIGLGYMTSSGIYYQSGMTVEYCEGAVLQ